MHALQNIKCSQNLEADHNRSARPLEETVDAIGRTSVFFSSSGQALFACSGSGTLGVLQLLGAIVRL